MENRCPIAEGPKHGTGISVAAQEIESSVAAQRKRVEDNALRMRLVEEPQADDVRHFSIARAEDLESQVALAAEVQRRRHA